MIAHGFHCIQEYIQEDLFHLLPVQHDMREGRRQLFFNLDLPTTGFGIDEVEAGGYDGIHVFLGQLRIHVTGVVENFLDQALDSMDIFEHDLTESLNEFRVVFSLRGELDEGFDRRQWIPNFVGKSCGDGF